VAGITPLCPERCLKDTPPDAAATPAAVAASDEPPFAVYAAPDAAAYLMSPRSATPPFMPALPHSNLPDSPGGIVKECR